MDAEAAAVAPPTQSIASHTTRAQETVGSKRQRDESPPPPARPAANRGPPSGPSNLPAKPDDVRRVSHFSSSCSVLVSFFFLPNVARPMWSCSLVRAAAVAACYVRALYFPSHLPCPPPLCPPWCSLSLPIAYSCHLPLLVIALFVVGCRTRYVTAMEWSLSPQPFPSSQF